METDREKLYRQFGPKLLEAIARVLKDEINILRDAAHGLSPRTNQQMMDAIQTKLDGLDNYDWMG